MGTVTPLQTKQSPNKEKMLALVESMRQQVESGEIIALSAIGVGKKGAYSAAGVIPPNEQLSMLGALELFKGEISNFILFEELANV